MYGLTFQKKIVEELLRGREVATKLLTSRVVCKRSSSSQVMISTTATSDRVSKDDVDLVLKIFKSFENCIDLLTAFTTTATTTIPEDHTINIDATTTIPEYHTVNIDATTIIHEKSADNYNIIGVDAKSPKYDVNVLRPNSEEAEVNYKCISTPIIDRNQIARNKRRKLSTGTLETVNSPVLVDDGHAWRKYGQKMIRNAKYSRDYFRCSNKYDQGCKATKQVQKISDNPAVYKTIRHDHHTCINHLSSPNNYINDHHHHHDYSSGFTISFGKTNNHNNKLLSTDHEDYPFLSSFESTKHDDQPKPVVLIDHNHQNIDQQEDHDQSMLSPDDHDDLMTKTAIQTFSEMFSPTLELDPLDVDFGAFFGM